jgi:hypothetical protein
MSFRKIDTKRLFYKKWLYKIVIESKGLGHLHRSKCADQLLSLPPETPLDNRWGSAIVYDRKKDVWNNRKDLLNLTAFLELTLTDKEFQTRYESDNVSIFTNDAQLVDTISVGVKTFIKEVHSPHSDEEALFLTSNKNKVICTALPHEKFRYKMYFKDGNKPTASFLNNFLTWSDKFNDGRIHIPDGTRRILSGNAYPYFYGHYFYVKDQKIASMAMLYVGEHLHKTEEFILKEEIA